MEFVTLGNGVKMPMHYRSEHTRVGRDWRGLPNGGVHIEPASYICRSNAQCICHKLRSL